MNNPEIVRRRLHNHRLVGAPFEKPEEVVHWLGAVQAQDYPAAKWALAQRMKDITDTALDQAFAAGTILRTHLLRPTWHFVTPADIHWLLALTAPRVHAVNAPYYRKFGLDDAVFKRSHAALAKALRGGNERTRTELASVLQRAGLATDGTLRLSYLLMRAELDGLICSGARQGKQFTYALLEERAPQASALTRSEALAELARRYFTSRGPASLPGFVWWSGLTAADARAGLERVKPALMHEAADGQTYWFAADGLPAKVKSPRVHLLPNYDEYTICTKDRGPLFDPARIGKLDSPDDALFPHAIVIDGFIVGMWKRTFEKGSVVITARAFAPLTDAEHRAFAAAAGHYGKFLGMPVILR